MSLQLYTAGQLAWRDEETPHVAYAQVWEEVQTFLNVNPNLEVKAIFGKLQRQYPSKFQLGQEMKSHHGSDEVRSVKVRPE